MASGGPGEGIRKLFPTAEEPHLPFAPTHGPGFPQTPAKLENPLTLFRKQAPKRIPELQEQLRSSNRPL